jgi:hypothetical protein
MLYEVGGTAFLLLGTGLVMLYFFQSKLLYYPTIPAGSTTTFLPASHYVPPESFTEVFFKTTDNLKLQAYMIQQKNPQDAYTLLFFHGNTYKYIY